MFCLEFSAVPMLFIKISLLDTPPPSNSILQSNPSYTATVSQSLDASHLLPRLYPTLRPPDNQPPQTTARPPPDNNHNSHTIRSRIPETETPKTVHTSHSTSQSFTIHHGTSPSGTPQEPNPWPARTTDDPVDPALCLESLFSIRSNVTG